VALDRIVSMKPLRFYLGVFLVTASSLMLQVIQTRVLSVMLWYYMAFLVISLAMFGITAGTIWVYHCRQRFSERTLSHDLTYFTSALAIVTALAAAVEMTLAPIGEGGATVTTIVVWLEFGACLAVPFCLSGVVISLALTRSPFPIGRVYGVDLAGAAAGCLGALTVLNLTDGPSAILWVSAIAALGALCFAGSRIGDAPAAALPFTSRFLRPRHIFVVLALAAAVNGVTGKGLQPLFVKGKPEFGEKAPVFSEWNAFARISMVGSGVLPAIMWGPSPTFKPQEWPVDQRGMVIDGDAGTVSYRWDGNADHAGFLKYDVTNIAHFLPGHERAAVIGVGGGRDMLSARVFGVPDVTGVELNPILVRLLTAPGYADFSGLSRATGMHFYVDEGRSWFARSVDKFDSIQMSLVDTWAATGAGAYTLSENGLYTVDAWRIFLDHLTPNGVFTVSRWYAQDNVDETGRLVSLAGATLFGLGEKDIRQHLFLVASGSIATLVVSRSPLSAENLALLNQAAADKQYQILLAPDRDAASPVLQRIVTSANIEDLQRYTSSLPLDLTPSTDERPFFFNQLPLFNPWRAIEEGLRKRGTGVTSGSTTATTTLVLLFLMSLLIVVRTIVAPLQPAIADVGRRLATGGTAYFLLIGAGFMFSEIGLLQRLSVFLGHPIYSLSIVLFSLILTTGIGSLISDILPLNTRYRFFLWAILVAGYLAALPSWLPSMLHTFESANLMVRGLLCVLVIAPAGVLMGFGFPTGMRFINAVDRTPTPWFWGINGAAGVLASSTAVAISIAFGIYMTFLTSAVCYALLIPAGLIMGFKPLASSAPLPGPFAADPARSAI
jgi:hypothetical protein